MPGGKKRSHILKQTCSFQLQVCLSMWDLFVTTRHQRVKIETPAHVCSVNFTKFVTKIFLQQTFGRLPLEVLRRIDILLLWRKSILLTPVIIITYHDIKIIGRKFEESLRKI